MAVGGRFFSNVLLLPLWPGHVLFNFFMVQVTSNGVTMVSVYSVFSLCLSLRRGVFCLRCVEGML